MIKYKLIKELEENPSQTQRSLAQKLNISLGKVNYLLSGLVEKGELNLAEAETAIRRMSDVTSNMFHGFVNVLDGEYWQHGPEDFLTHDVRVGVGVEQDRRCDESVRGVGRSAECDGSASLRFDQ